jgi:sugar O-acyltransferase (sialic acid O-acetyltransferase NeuD family)
MIRVIIIGAGGFGREVLDTLNYINSIETKYQIIGFVDNYIPIGTNLNGVEVLGKDELLEEYSRVSLVIAIANPHVRQSYFNRFKNDFDFPVIVHPTAIISEFAKIGNGSIIQAFCIVAANSIVGNCVLINARSGVGHDASVGDFSSIQSFCDITGNSRIGNLCFLGTGVKIIPKLIIADECYICAGAVIFKDILTKSKVLGNPAKIII